MLVSRRVPGSDRPFANRFGLIGHDPMHVELNDVAVAFAGRACSQWAAEAQPPRFWVGKLPVADGAFEAPGEIEARRAAMVESKRGPGKASSAISIFGQDDCLPI